MSETRNCPKCDHDSVVRVLDLPVCQQRGCDWAGAVPVDSDWNPKRAKGGSA